MWIAERLRRAPVEFARCRKANVAVVFAMATLPIIGFVGASVDYSRANAVKAGLQSALDATALLLAKEAATDTAATLQANALSYFNANFHPRATVSNTQISANYSADGGSKVLVTGQVDVPTTFSAIFGIKKITIGSSSTSSWGTARLRVALALDNTGSMAEAGKMGALKNATKNLLQQLQSAAASDGDVYVSLIPFSKDVNVGTAYQDADWIDWTVWDDTNGYCTTSGNNGDWSWGGSSASFYTDKKSCQAHKYKWVVSTNKGKWNGCITDRLNSTIPNGTADFDQSNFAPDPSIPDSLFPAENYASCPTAMMGLSYDWKALQKVVDSMSPQGNTNQPIGLVWGWQSLTGGGPFVVPAQSSLYTYKQFIVLLSDGLNTQNRFSSVQSDIDQRMYDPSANGAGTCENIKASGITIYTIQVNTGGDPTSTLLKNCASKPSYFYEIKQANQIADVFSEIGTGLTTLRIAK